VKSHFRSESILKFVNIFPLMPEEKGQPRPELFVEDRLQVNPASYAIRIKAITRILPTP
jgi:hypothetical protein